MQRPPRPEPTRISSYFFEQLHPQPGQHDADSKIHGSRDDATKMEGTSPNEEEHENCTTATAIGDEHKSAFPAPSVDLARLFETDCTSSHRDGAGVPAPIFRSSPQQQQQQQQRELQETLWSSYTPTSYREAFSTFLTDEDDVTERLRRAVAEAWASVERIMQRNNDRRAHLAALTDNAAAWRAEVRSKLYWQSEDIVSRYGLEVGGQSSTEAATASTAAKQRGDAAENRKTSNSNESEPTHPSEDGEEHVLLDFSVLQENPLGSSLQGKAESDGRPRSNDSGEDDAEEGGRPDVVRFAGRVTDVSGASAPQRAKAWTTTTKDLLDPCARPHPLRRLFSPLLQQQQRETLPKWTTLLLNEVRDLQRTQLPDLEARLQSSVLFKVPLHRPFLEARAALQACVTQRRTAPEVESGQVTAYRQVEQLGKRLLSFLKERQQQQEHEEEYSGKKKASEEEDPVMDMEERWATAETLWTMLLTELDACKRFIADAMPRCTTLHDIVHAENEGVTAALQRHRAACDSTLARMKAEAQTCAALLTRNGQRTLTAVAEMGEKYTPDETRLRSAIARRRTELTQLEVQQEKNVRRVREALKACFMDQMKYEEAAQALLQDQLTLAQLETSHQQLRQAVQVRHDGAVECEKHAAQLTQLLADGDTVAHAFFAACEAHTRRMADEDYFIQCRLVDQCTLALQQRCRCLHAMTALYDQRYATLERRASRSWQLQFLLSGEQDWAVANLADVRAEFALLEQDWETLRAMRQAMKLEAVELDLLVRGPAWAEMRGTLLQLDAPPALQRRLPTLRAHAEALAHPAAGCGPQAVRRLLTG